MIVDLFKGWAKVPTDDEWEVRIEFNLYESIQLAYRSGVFVVPSRGGWIVPRDIALYWLTFDVYDPYDD